MPCWLLGYASSINSVVIFKGNLLEEKTMATRPFWCSSMTPTHTTAARLNRNKLKKQEYGDMFILELFVDYYTAYFHK